MVQRKRFEDPLPDVAGAGRPLEEGPGIFREVVDESVLKLEEWNSRSSWRSVCPRSPCSVGQHLNSCTMS